MEFVLVVPRRELFDACYPQGFVPFGEETSREAFDAAVARAAFFVERAHAEHEPELKQVIPYTLVVREHDGRTEVLLLRRLARGGESRLFDKLSIGVGGHVEPEDLPARGSRRAALDAGARRELFEELQLEEEPTLHQVGLVNDDSNPVGAVHLGLVQVARARGDVRVLETDRLEGSFVALDELRRLRADGANLESWSALLVDRLDLVLPTAARSLGALAL